MLGTGEAYFTDADLDCSDFLFLLIAQIKQKLQKTPGVLIKEDPAGYVLRVDSFWLNKPRWDPSDALSIILKSCYCKGLILERVLLSRICLYFT